jgi:hypothetical protein
MRGIHFLYHKYKKNLIFFFDTIIYIYILFMDLKPIYVSGYKQAKNK